MSQYVLFQFNLLGVDFQIIDTREGVFLVAPQIASCKIKTALPRPGGYNTSTATSTYDTRGETTISCRVIPKTKSRVFIEANVCTTCEYWYYGSIGDDWHSREPDIEVRYLCVEMDRGLNVTYKEIFKREIPGRLRDSEWMKDLINSALLPCQQIVREYHYCWEDGKEAEESSQYYPQRGVLLYSFEPEKPRWPTPQRGPFSSEGWREVHEVYLLETGQIATVERRSRSYCRKVSFFHDESGEDIYTEMKIWKPDEIKREEEKITKAVANMIEMSAMNKGGSPDDD